MGGRTPHISIDSNGNLTSKTEGSTTWAYEWDAENRLKRVLSNGVEQARFAYDPLGRRIEKVANAVTTRWTYDGWAVLREILGATTSRYVLGPEIDEPLAQEDSTGALTYLHVDGLGSVVKTTNSAGAVTTSRRYDAFGNFELGATNGYGFTGREWDPEISLAYYRARYYDPKIGRFLSEDPIRFEGGMNFYAYVENNPLSAIDPFGLRSIMFMGCQVWFMDDQGNIVKECAASSGKPGSTTKHQGASFFGPTPEGTYTINPTEFTGGWRSWFRSPGWGRWRAPMHPTPDTNTRGRRRFFFHGDTRGDAGRGSAGCIDVGDCDEWARNWAMEQPDASITVFVRYIGGVCN